MGVKSEYRRLGDIIHPVDRRNVNLSGVGPMGVNIDKFFMPSVANVIGTDLSNYKLVGFNQFACNLMHVGRDERLPVALHKGVQEITVSPAYYVFEINEGCDILPDYLMLWFKRSEFDRNAWYYTDSDVRGGLDKASMYDLKVWVPGQEEQRQIVSKYNAVCDRISTCMDFISNLEKTAQAFYREMFSVASDNLPDGWTMGKLADIAEDVGLHINSVRRDNYPIYLPIECLPRKSLLYTESLDVSFAESSLITFRKDDIIMGAMRPYFHKVVIARSSGITRSTCMVVRPQKASYWAFLVMLLFSDETIQYATANSLGTTMPYVNWTIMSKMKTVIPSEDEAQQFNKIFQPIFEHMSSVIEEVKTLNILKDSLLKKLV